MSGEVSVPILWLMDEHDEQVPAAHAGIVRQGVPDASQVTHRVVANAGHYAFLSPFPTAMATPGFAPARDPSRFDRVRFHETLLEEIAAFPRAEPGARNRH
jgi:dienelactone hydrolase